VPDLGELVVETRRRVGYLVAIAGDDALPVFGFRGIHFGSTGGDQFGDVLLGVLDVLRGCAQLITNEFSGNAVLLKSRRAHVQLTSECPTRFTDEIIGDLTRVTAGLSAFRGIDRFVGGEVIGGSPVAFCIFGRPVTM
jgi:hypothetical protein